MDDIISIVVAVVALVLGSCYWLLHQAKYSQKKSRNIRGKTAKKSYRR